MNSNTGYKTMSLIDLKRANFDLDNHSLSNEKRIKKEEDTATTELDLNDYRNFRIKEENVGILEFVSSNKAFKCELKQRFSDFIVHEISSNGQIIELTNSDLPIGIFEENDDEDRIVDEEILDLISNELRQQLEQLNDNEAKTNEPILINVDDKDKHQRTKIHRFIKRYSNLESLTFDLSSEKHIKVIEKAKKGNQTRRTSDNWPKSLPIYLHFTFYQENKGTTDGLADLAKKLRVNIKNVGYAGLKDKRAISTQQCSLFKIKPQRLAEFNRRALNYKFPSFTGNFEFKEVPLFLGDSIGNKFQIVLRDVELDSQTDLKQSIENVKLNGFLNYFGIQRFGHSEYPSHRIGIAIIKKQYKEAIDLILRLRLKDLEPPSYAKQTKTFNECLKIYREDNDAGKAFKQFYWKSTNEGHLLRGLNLYGKNYLQAFTEIPRGNRSFYCHSFQSFIWNQIASFRFRTYGLQLVIGDLVVKKKASNENKEEEKNEKDTKIEKVKLNYIRDFDNEDVILIDESNINDYAIFDVVLPLIGPQTQNPKNAVNDEIRRLLSELEIDHEKQLNTVGDIFYITGKYRRFLAKPIDLKYELVNYDDNTIRLFSTDLDKLNKVEYNCANEGSKLGIKLDFFLPSSTYATILVRELSRQNV